MPFFYIKFILQKDSGLFEVFETLVLIIRGSGKIAWHEGVLGDDTGASVLTGLRGRINYLKVSGTGVFDINYHILDDFRTSTTFIPGVSKNVYKS